MMTIISNLNIYNPSRGIKFYVGGWHSEKYFADIKDTILNTFQFNLENIGKENLEVIETNKNIKECICSCKER